MKINKLAAVAGFTSILVLAGAIESIANTRISTANNLSNSTLIAAKDKQVVSSGRFVTVDKRTRGMVKIVEKNGQRFVELQSNFRTANGPALEVILHRNSRVSKSIDEGSYVSLATLKKVNGKQLYLIPDNVNINDFQSVAIRRSRV